jgi:hypothetical protein
VTPDRLQGIVSDLEYLERSAGEAGLAAYRAIMASIRAAVNLCRLREKVVQSSATEVRVPLR